MTTGHPLVSIIIPAYQCQATLGRTLESVRQQGYAPIEIIVMDDGSTDATSQIAAEAAAADPRIHYFRQANQGPAAARNAAVARASGEYLAFMDHDDEWQPGKLQQQADLLSQHGDIDFIFTESLEVDAAQGRAEPLLAGRYARALGTLERQALAGQADVFLVSAASLRPVVFNLGFITLSSVMLRRGLFEQLGGFDTARRGTDDVDFWVRATRRARFAYCAQPLTLHHHHRSNMSQASATWHTEIIRHLQMALVSPDYADLRPLALARLRERYRWLIFFYGRHGQPRQAWAAWRESRAEGFDGLSALGALGAWLGPLPFRAVGRLLWR